MSAPRHVAVVLVVVFVVVFATALAACGSDASVKETKDGKVSVDGSGKDAKVTVDGEHGAQATYNQRTVPSGFPSDVPRPRLKLTSATGATRGGTHYFQLSYALGTSSARVALGAYADQLDRAGLTADSVQAASSTGPPTALRADGKGWHVVAIAASGSGPGSLLVTVNDA